MTIDLDALLTDLADAGIKAGYDNCEDAIAIYPERTIFDTPMLTVNGEGEIDINAGYLALDDDAIAAIVIIQRHRIAAPVLTEAGR